MYIIIIQDIIAQSGLLYMHYLDTNIVLLVFVLLANIDDNI